MPEILRLKNVLRPKAAFHIGRTYLPAGRGFRAHRHDFSEFFLVESGRGVHEVNGKRVPLEAGSLVWMRPRDLHAVLGEELRMVNIAFDTKEVLAFLRRYLDPLPAFFVGGALPGLLRLEPDAVRWFGLRLGRIGASRTRLDRDLLLLELLERLAFRGSSGMGSPAVPPWILELLDLARDPAVFIHGTRGLVEKSGHSAEHLAREMRRHTGKTPTQIVNEARLAWAAQRLEVSDDDPGDLAHACGFSSAAHFYELFGRRFGASPVRWRKNARSVFAPVVG
ncbi:MAG: helix-turn-helix domain-containing protein [Spirochaetes bacterium]|nr:helix-turn-helix domain-containing protein [Spirochaetota bacterium]